jgi:hypothetical protein
VRGVREWGVGSGEWGKGERERGRGKGVLCRFKEKFWVWAMRVFFVQFYEGKGERDSLRFGVD